MSKREIYTFRVLEPNLRWTCIKADTEFNPTGTYAVSHLGANYECGCFAGNKSTCRHRQMVVEFEVEKRFDSNWWYHYETKRWIEGPSHDGE